METTLQIGDLVRLDEGIGSAAARRLTYRVTKVKNVTVDVEPTTGGRPANVKMEFVTKVNTESGAIVSLVDFQPALDLGMIVRYSRRPGLFVVLAITADAYRIAKLGGDDFRYLKGIPRSFLTEVKLSEIGITN